MNQLTDSLDEQFLEGKNLSGLFIEHHFSLAALVIIILHTAAQFADGFGQWNLGEFHLVFTVAFFSFAQCYLLWYIKYISNKLLLTNSLNTPVLCSIVLLIFNVGYQWLMNFNTYLDEERVVNVPLSICILAISVWLYIAIFRLKINSYTFYFRRWVIIGISLPIVYYIWTLLSNYLRIEISANVNQTIYVLKRIAPDLILAWMIIKEPQLNLKDNLPAEGI